MHLDYVLEYFGCFSYVCYLSYLFRIVLCIVHWCIVVCINLLRSLCFFSLPPTEEDLQQQHFWKLPHTLNAGSCALTSGCPAHDQDADSGNSASAALTCALPQCGHHSLEAHAVLRGDFEVLPRLCWELILGMDNSGNVLIRDGAMRKMENTGQWEIHMNKPSLFHGKSLATDG